MEIKPPSPVEILSLGFGWIASFIGAELKTQHLSFASTSRDGSNGTIPFTFDPLSKDSSPYYRLPHARTIVIIFPLLTDGSHKKLIDMYNQTHKDARGCTRWIQLGSTSAFDNDSSEKSPLPLWRDRHSKVDTTKPRVKTEEELLELPLTSACVFNLAGLWGGSRNMRLYVSRVVPTKEALSSKGSLHMIHGIDIARCISAMHGNFIPGRWLLTDMRVYDWWELVSAWGAREEGTATKEHVAWVADLMMKNEVRGLPRSPEQMGGKALDSRDFWNTFTELRGPIKAGMGME